MIDKNIHLGGFLYYETVTYKKVFFHFSKILCYVVLRDNIKFLQFSFSLLLFSLVDDFEQPYLDELGKVSLAN